MTFSLDQSVDLLARTPDVLNAFLRNASNEWITRKEPPDGWSPFDVVAHLIQGEESDWLARVRIILYEGEGYTFKPFDRDAHFESSRGRTLADLLDTFARLRRRSLDELARMQVTPAQLELRGTHPEFGTVTLGQLLAAWVVHDLNHIAQIARVMAKQYREEVGPWLAYLPLLNDRLPASADQTL
jgi:hypothetical protein